MLITRGSKAYIIHLIWPHHYSDKSICTHIDAGTTDLSKKVPHLPLRAAAHVPREGLQRRELCGIAGEGVKEADGSVMVPLQQEDAVDRVEDAVILEKGGA